MTEGIIFDWFGVCMERWVPLWKREIDKKADSGPLEESFLRYMHDYAIDSISGHEFLKAILKKIHVDPEDYHYLLRIFPPLNHELLDMILSLRESGYKTAVLSDNFKDIVPIIEEKIGGFERYFDVICLSNRLGMGKRHKQIYMKTGELLSEVGADDKNYIFIDDMQIHLDIAKQIGWKTILYENNPQLRNELREHGVTMD